MQLWYIFLSGSGSVRDDVVSFWTTLTFNKDNSLPIDAMTIKEELQWSEQQMNDVMQLFITNGNIKVGQFSNEAIEILSTVGTCNA